MTVPWKPAKTATPEQTKRAVELLQSGEWAEGKVWPDPSDPDVQYRAARHPNYGKPGTHPGVEVWTRVAESPHAIVATTSSSDRERVLDEFEKRGWPRAEADAMVAIESAWDPTARNKQGFGGLIGFGPWLQKKWGVYPVWEKRPTIAGQVELVGRYLDEAVTKKWRVPGDTYLTGAAPSYIGAPDWQVVYKRGSKAWEQNPGWRGPDGEITAGSIRAVVLRKMKRMASAPSGGEPTASPKGPAVVPSCPPSGSESQAPGSGTSSRARAGAAIASAVAAVGSALAAAMGNPWLIGGLVLALVVLVAFALWLVARERRKP
jgi:hypothetical protein